MLSTVVAFAQTWLVLGGCLHLLLALQLLDMHVFGHNLLTCCIYSYWPIVEVKSKQLEQLDRLNNEISRLSQPSFFQIFLI
jgi:hypothetical protein